MSKLRMVGAVILFVVVAAGCESTTSTETPISLATRNPHIRGQIINVYLDNGEITGIMVEGTEEVDTVYARAIVGITEETQIFIRTNNSFSKVSADNLKEGQSVEVLFTGAIQTSDPVQATALEIAIIE